MENMDGGICLLYSRKKKKKPVFLNKVNSLVSFFFYRDFAFWHFDTQVQVQPYSKLNDTVVD
jgi:hypothetical protein